MFRTMRDPINMNISTFSSAARSALTIGTMPLCFLQPKVQSPHKPTLARYFSEEDLPVRHDTLYYEGQQS